MLNRLLLSQIIVLAAATLVVGCGDDESSDTPAEWSDWKTYPDEDSFGEFVEGLTWVHEPTFKADKERQFRYTASPSRPVDAYVAPSDDCRETAAYDAWTDIGDELIIDDYGDELSGDSGTPVCVSFYAHLISEDGQWTVNIEYRER